MAFRLNQEIIVDYLRTFPDRQGETLLHFGDSWHQPDRQSFDQRGREVVRKLAQRGYIAQPGKISGDTQLVELVRIVEQTGFTEADLKPVPPERLLTKLKELVPSYPATQETVRFRDREQIVVCVEI